MRNMETIKTAATNGSTSWNFELPDGSTVNLPFDPMMAVQIADIGYTHAKLISLAQLQASDDDGAIQTMAEARSALSDVTLEGTKRVWDDMTEQSNAIADTPGGARKAFQLRHQRIDFVARCWARSRSQTTTGALGVPFQQVHPVADVDLNANPTFTEEDLATIGGWLDSADSDRLLYLSQNDATGRPGIGTDGDLNPDRAFWTWTWNTVDTKWEKGTIDDGGEFKELFTMVTEADEATGLEHEVPFYRSKQNPDAWVPVDSGGITMYQKPDAIENLILVRSNQPVSVNRSTSNQQAPGQQNLGPMEPVAQRGYFPGAVRVIRTGDATDPLGDRGLAWYNIPGTKVWVAAPIGELPEMVYNGTGVVTQDPVQGLMVDGKVVTPDVISRDFTWYGLDGRLVNGKPGVGSQDRILPVRGEGPGGTISTTLSDEELWSLGGAYWPIGKTRPYLERAARGYPVRTHAAGGGHPRADGTRTGSGPRGGTGTAPGGRGPRPQDRGIRWVRPAPRHTDGPDRSRRQGTCHHTRARGR